jgi:hypothetical protein
MGFACHFRPTYAGANVGHPSGSRLVRILTSGLKKENQICCIRSLNLPTLWSGADGGKSEGC